MTQNEKTTPGAGAHTPAPVGRKKKTLAYRMIKLTVDLVIFSMLAAIMFTLKVVLAGLPNIEPVSLLIIVFTAVYRFRALIPIYVYVMLDGVMQGFSVWWLPYLYAFTILWAITMLFPKKMPRSVGTVVYPAVCALHGLFFGTLYAPVLIWVQGFDLTQTITWLSAGLSFDLLHFFGNLMAGLLILPLSQLLKRLTKNMY